jgi:hypothetical protein
MPAPHTTEHMVLRDMQVRQTLTTIRLAAQLLQRWHARGAATPAETARLLAVIVAHTESLPDAAIQPAPDTIREEPHAATPRADRG